MVRADETCEGVAMWGDAGWLCGIPATGPGADAAWEAMEKAQRGEQALLFIRDEGYVPCDILACNCNSWHGGHYARRLQAADDALEAAGVARVAAGSMRWIPDRITMLAAERDAALAEVERLRRLNSEVLGVVSDARAERDAALARVAELEAERDALDAERESIDLAGVTLALSATARDLRAELVAAKADTALLEDTLHGLIAERDALKARKPVVCGTCDGRGWLHRFNDGTAGAPCIPRCDRDRECPDCGLDGAGKGVRWEK
jgi:hypothetical protein